MQSEKTLVINGFNNTQSTIGKDQPSIHIDQLEQNERKRSGGHPSKETTKYLNKIERQYGRKEQVANTHKVEPIHRIEVKKSIKTRKELNDTTPLVKVNPLLDESL